jgi:hypothetical protein
MIELVAWLIAEIQAEFWGVWELLWFGASKC